MVRLPMKEYDAYRETGLDWLPHIPSHWQLRRAKYLLAEVGQRSVTGAETLLSLSKIHGIVQRDSLAERAGQAESLVGYKIVEPDNIVINRMQAANGLIAVSNISGITSPDYGIYRVVDDDKIDPHIVGHLLCLPEYQGEIKRRVTGVMEGFIRLYSNELFEIPLIVAPLSEQKSISRFIRDATCKIDEAIALEERQIAFLKERKQIVIQNAVTKGLNPDAPMKDSGVDWIGEIPAHWTLKKIKHVLKERNERSQSGDEPLLMMSQTHGLVVRSEYHEKAEVAESSVDNKIVKSGDLVFNKLKAHLGVFFKSEIPFDGIVSPDYAVYKPYRYVSDLKFFEILFRHPKYIEQFIARSSGIVEGLIRLYTSELFDIYVPIPPDGEQRSILAEVQEVQEQLDRAIGIKIHQIASLKEYKATLINSAVTGKIKVA